MSRLGLSLIAAILLLAGRTSGQAPVRWALAYSMSGGVAGSSRTVTVTAAGRIQVEDRGLGRLDVLMDRDMFVRVRDAAERAREVAPPSRTATYPGQVVSSLTVTSEGRTRHVEPTPELLNALLRGADIGIWQALVGTWRQAALTYCAPNAHLSPADVEPAIERLTFNGDGTFSVHWPGDPHGAGARPTPLPSLRGAFRASLTGGSLELTVEDGVTPPRDFSGTGSFRFDGERRLLLRGLWFGTRSAAAKPDVCELAFEKE